MDNEGACSCEQRKTKKKIKATFLIFPKSWQKLNDEHELTCIEQKICVTSRIFWS